MLLDYFLNLPHVATHYDHVHAACRRRVDHVGQHDTWDGVEVQVHASADGSHAAQLRLRDGDPPCVLPDHVAPCSSVMISAIRSSCLARAMITVLASSRFTASTTLASCS